jgi:hypothetical protein
MRRRLAVLLSLTILCPLVAAATAIPVSSYSMPNGGTGSFNYQDTTYVPCASNCTTTGAPLSGGTGKLTDGIIPAADWTAGNPEPWVGWENGQTNGANPTATFFFSGLPTINSVTVWYDNAKGSGGVSAPSAIGVNGISHAVPPSLLGGPQAFTISGLSITASSIDVQFFQSSAWVMIGEVTFDGSSSSATPEPATLALLGSGLLSVAGLLRRKTPART